MVVDGPDSPEPLRGAYAPGNSGGCGARRLKKCRASGVFNERPDAQLVVSALELLFGIHDDRAVPGNRLLDRLTRYEQETDTLVTGLDADLVTAVEQHQ